VSRASVGSSPVIGISSVVASIAASTTTSFRRVCSGSGCSAPSTTPTGSSSRSAPERTSCTTSAMPTSTSSNPAVRGSTAGPIVPSSPDQS
jgi:hypothetical protein